MDVLHAETSILFLCKVVTSSYFHGIKGFSEWFDGEGGFFFFFFLSKARIIDFEDTLRGASDLFN